jgi:hypothetical protein
MFNSSLPLHNRREYEELQMITQDLRIWLELEVPLIEDGNSFGAEVQGVLIRDLNEPISVVMDL